MNWNIDQNFPTNGTGIFIIIIIFFRIENMNGIELYHLQNTGKFFGFSREKEARILIIIIIFFRIENMNGIELYHLQNTGKFFGFSREKEARWYW